MTSNRGDPDDGGAPPLRPPSGNSSSSSSPAAASPIPPFANASAAPPIAKFYKPDVYRYKCRGALHLGDGHPPPPDNDDGSGLPLCRGLQSKLRHVATLPPVLSREEAIRTFEREFAPPPPVPYDDDDGGGGGGGGYDGKGIGGVAPPAPPASNGDDRDRRHRESLSCYGTTEVSVLALREGSVSANDRSSSTSPFGHPLAGVLGPFGGFGGPSPLSSMIDDAFKDLHDRSPGDGDGDAGSGGHRRQRGSVMRSSSTRSSRDSEGNWVTTKETTVVDADGTRRTTSERTVRKADGTVETTVANSDDDGGEGPSKTKTTTTTGGNVLDDVAKNATAAGAPTAATTTGRWGEDDDDDDRRRQAPPEIAAIAPECRLGLTVSTVEDDDRGNTIAAFRVGPVEVAFGDSYDVLDDGYEEAIVPDPKRRGVRGAEGGGEDGGGGGDSETGGRRRTPASRRPGDAAKDFSEKFLSSLERTGESVKKNASAIREGLSDDFPSRFAKSGEKIAGNLGKTMERTGKLAYEVFKMWGSSDDDDGGDDDDEQRGGGGGGRRR